MTSSHRLVYLEQCHQKGKQFKITDYISKGKGIKVGILDHCFGYKLHKDVFKAGVDFIDSPDSLNNSEEHGYWMAAAGLWTTPSDLARVGLELQHIMKGEENRILK